VATHGRRSGLESSKLIDWPTFRHEDFVMLRVRHSQPVIFYAELAVVIVCDK